MSVNQSVVRSVVKLAVKSVVASANAATQRYFTTLAASGSQHWTIPQVLSGESITMDVYPTNGNTGLPPGAPSVTDNVYQTITFTLTGNMDFIGRNGASFFDGIIANVLVNGRIYRIDEDWTTSVLHDSSGNNQDGTAVNITSADSEEFTQGDGAWLGGDERLSNGDFNTAASWTLPASWSIAGGKLTGDGTVTGIGFQSVIRPVTYRVSGLLDSLAGSIMFYDGSDYSSTVSTSGNFEFNVTNANISYNFFTFRALTGSTFILDNISMKRILEVV